jgi:hypothetical protein
MLYAASTARWFLRNSNSTGFADLDFVFGPPGSGMIPLAGDWDGVTSGGVAAALSASDSLYDPTLEWLALALEEERRADS